ncbi:MAG: DUF3572 domain-containing protein [Bauldia sp.]|nr:DUF3572 domain-containing protein [Bauldia sp.]
MHRRDSLKPGKIRGRDDAETLAVQALAFLASRPDDLDRFIALTGLAPDTIRDSAARPDFLGGVLDHYLGDERLLIEFANDAGMPPEAIAEARHALDAGA